ncbi:MAG: hypothetical protein AB1512_23050 [Thermodesulfobacteriota bacterium]
MPENDHPEKAGLHAVLFPHSGLSEEGLGRILSFFEHLTLFLPWHMEEPEIEGGGMGCLKVVRPPEAMKPVTGFRGLLSEYRRWMADNDLRGYTPLLRASLGGGRQAEPTTQEIREALRPGPGGNPTRAPDEFTRWHLVLHLYRLMEEQEEEASRVLAALRERSSPLRGVIEEEAEEGLFDDLPPFEPNRIEEPQELERVCEAWFGLFAGMLLERDLLVTRNRRLFAYLSGSWQERYGAEGLDAHPVSWLWPDLFGIGIEALGRERSRVFQDECARELRRAFKEFRKGPGGGFSGLRRASGRLDRSWVHRYSPRVLRVSMIHFPRLPEGSLYPKAKALGNVLDRPIIHVEGAPGGEDA